MQGHPCFSPAGFSALKLGAGAGGATGCVVTGLVSSGGSGGAGFSPVARNSQLPKAVARAAARAGGDSI